MVSVGDGWVEAPGVLEVGSVGAGVLGGEVEAAVGWGDSGPGW